MFPESIRTKLWLVATVGIALVAMFGSARAGGFMGARAMARSGDNPAASAVTLEQNASGARLVFTMTSIVSARALVLENPDRIVVDLPETAFVLDPAAGRMPASESQSLVKAFRFGLFAPGKSRIVIDLASPAKVLGVKSALTEAGGAAQLSIRLAPTDPAAFHAAADEATKQIAETAPAMTTDSALPIVVLDPGHGGTDNGASAAKDVLEKTVVFDFAKMLAAKLESRGQVRVVMTRKDDTFIPLADRVKIAEDAGAGLFVSIHADTLAESGVQGATVYTLSDRASDAQAARVAESENAADRAGGLADTAEAAGLNDILSDLTRRETKVLGRSFARGLVAAWRDVGELNKNPLRSAGFRVLKAADFPSVLVELGYLSNTRDLSRLTSPEWRDRATDTVAASIERFFKSNPASDSGALTAGQSGVSTPIAVASAPR